VKEKVICKLDVSLIEVKLLRSYNADIPIKGKIYTISNAMHFHGKEIALHFKELNHGTLSGYSPNAFISLKRVETHLERIVIMCKIY